MASNEVLMSRNEEDIIEPTQDDIPGTKVTGAMDGYMMSKLKWWLLYQPLVVLWLLLIQHHEL